MNSEDRENGRVQSKERRISPLFSSTFPQTWRLTRDRTFASTKGRVQDYYSTESHSEGDGREEVCSHFSGKKHGLTRHRVPLRVCERRNKFEIMYSSSEGQPSVTNSSSIAVFSKAD